MNSRPGYRFLHGYQVLNALTDREANSRLTVRTRVLREGDLVYESNPEPVLFEKSDDPRHRETAGIHCGRDAIRL